MEDKLIGADAIADFLGISRRQFFRLKAQTEGTENTCPVISHTIGQPGKRKKIIWGLKHQLWQWYYIIRDSRKKIEKNENL